MKITDIEKNIPIPKKRTSRFDIMIKNLKRMEIGDSFVVIPGEGEKITIHGIAIAIARRNEIRKKKMKFRSRITEQGRIRVWRIE